MIRLIFQNDYKKDMGEVLGQFKGYQQIPFTESREFELANKASLLSNVSRFMVYVITSVIRQQKPVQKD